MGKPVYLLTFLLLTLFVAGCGTATPQELVFETIELINAPDSTKQWESPEPGLLIITSGEDAAQARRFVTDEAALTLSQVDFTTHLAILAFRGQQLSSHSGFQVEHVIRQRNEVRLVAQAGKLGGEDQVVSPYHLIKVQKTGNWGQTLTFTLYFDEAPQAAVSVTQQVP